MSEPPLEPGITKKKPKQFWELDYKKAFTGLRENVMNRRQFYLLMGVRFGYIIAAYTLPAYYKAFGLALHCMLYKVAQNPGKQVLRISYIKSHLLSFQFVVIPHGKRDLGS